MKLFLNQKVVHIFKDKMIRDSKTSIGSSMTYKSFDWANALGDTPSEKYESLYVCILEHLNIRYKNKTTGKRDNDVVLMFGTQMLNVFGGLMEEGKWEDEKIIKIGDHQVLLSYFPNFKNDLICLSNSAKVSLIGVENFVI